jgi:hypothetical protein
VSRQRLVTQWSIRLGERLALSNHLLEQLSARQADGTYQRTVGLSAVAHRCLIYAPPSLNLQMIPSE